MVTGGRKYNKTRKDEIRILVPSGLIGYGIPADSFKLGLQRDPHVIACDGGSSDPGPYYLASGDSITSEHLLKKDLQMCILAALERKIPFITSSAYTAGSRIHLEKTVGFVKEIAQEHSLRFRLATITADVDKAYVKTKLRAGKVRPLGSGVPNLTEEDVDHSIRIVGQMGVHPFIKALEEGADVIVAGRANDTAVIGAYPIWKGFDKGLVIHMAKIAECGALCCRPGGTDCIFAYMRQDHFVLDPPSPRQRALPITVAAHTFYEQASPVHIYEPDGLIDVSECDFEAETDRSVRVRGSKFTPLPYTIKLEGVAQEGYRTISVCGIRDPIFIEQLDSVMEEIREKIAQDFRGTDHILTFRIYGRNAVMGELEPRVGPKGHELGVIIDVVADTQSQANDICKQAQVYLRHMPYPGRKATAANIALPYSPHELSCGPVYKWSIYHLVDEDDPLKLFPVIIEEVKG